MSVIWITFNSIKEVNRYKQIFKQVRYGSILGYMQVQQLQHLNPAKGFPVLLLILSYDLINFWENENHNHFESSFAKVNDSLKSYSVSIHVGFFNINIYLNITWSTNKNWNWIHLSLWNHLFLAESKTSELFLAQNLQWGNSTARVKLQAANMRRNFLNYPIVTELY